MDSHLGSRLLEIDPFELICREREKDQIAGLTLVYIAVFFDSSMWGSSRNSWTARRRSSVPSYRKRRYCVSRYRALLFGGASASFRGKDGECWAMISSFRGNSGSASQFEAAAARGLACHRGIRCVLTSFFVFRYLLESKTKRGSLTEGMMRGRMQNNYVTVRRVWIYMANSRSVKRGLDVVGMVGNDRDVAAV